MVVGACQVLSEGRLRAATLANVVVSSHARIGALSLSLSLSFSPPLPLSPFLSLSLSPSLFSPSLSRSLVALRYLAQYQTQLLSNAQSKLEVDAKYLPSEVQQHRDDLSRPHLPSAACKKYLFMGPYKWGYTGVLS